MNSFEAEHWIDLNQEEPCENLEQDAPKEDSSKDKESSRPLLSNRAINLQTKYRKRNAKKVSPLLKKANFHSRYLMSLKKTAEARMRSANKKSTGEGHNSRELKKMTAPEQLVFDLLLEAGVSIKREFKLMGKYYDFRIRGMMKDGSDAIKIKNDLLKNARILVEVDGAYWHGKDKDNTMRQMRQRIEDRYKNVVAELKGFKLIRLWEGEITKQTLFEKIDGMLCNLYPDYKSDGWPVVHSSSKTPDSL